MVYTLGDEVKISPATDKEVTDMIQNLKKQFGTARIRTQSPKRVFSPPRYIIKA